MKLQPPRWPGQLVVRVAPVGSGATGGLQVLVLLFLLAATFTTQADITGTVTITGKPNSHDETFFARSGGCGESPKRTTENWKIGPKGELAEVVVWIVDPKFEFEADHGSLPPPEIEVKQMGCRYVPHVLAVQAGVPFKIINADPTLHNIRAKVYNGPGQPAGPDLFNFGQLGQGKVDEKQFDDPAINTLQCDVHPWMQCWVRVLPNRNFDVTTPDGTFKLWQSSDDKLTDGDYKILAWHPRFANPVETTAHVKNNTAVVNIQFDGSKSF